MLHHTADGFELVFGINHLGHVALTGLLRPALLAAPGARVVTVASLAHATTRIAFDNLDGAQGYRDMRANTPRKLANLLFAYELQRRLTLSLAPRADAGARATPYAATAPAARRRLHRP